MQPRDLPADFRELVTAGAQLLESLGARLREEATRHPEKPEIWLSVRDLEGLAGRLGIFTDEDWRRGFPGTLMGGQDLGVLDELFAGNGAHGLRMSNEQTSLVGRLRAFLQQYISPGVR